MVRREGLELENFFLERDGLLLERSGLLLEKSGLLLERSGLLLESSGLLLERSRLFCSGHEMFSIHQKCHGDAMFHISWRQDIRNPVKMTPVLHLGVGVKSDRWVWSWSGSIRNVIEMLCLKF